MNTIPPAAQKCKPDKERAAFLTGAYKTYVTERKRKRDDVSRRLPLGNASQTRSVRLS